MRLLPSEDTGAAVALFYLMESWNSLSTLVCGMWTSCVEGTTRWNIEYTWDLTGKQVEASLLILLWVWDWNS